jgi:hypothetical protein
VANQQECLIVQLRAMLPRAGEQPVGNRRE